MLKLYKKTVTLCIWVTVIAFGGSLLFEWCNNIILNFTFLINYLTGIACSAGVVLLTAYLQFQSEQQRLKREFSSALHDLFFCILLSLPGDEENLNDRQYKYLCERISSAFSNINHCCNEFCSFHKNEQEKFNTVHQQIALLYLAFAKGELDSPENAIVGITKCCHLIDAADAAISFLDDSFYRKSIAKYRDEIKKVLSVLSQQESSNKHANQKPS